MRDDGGLLLPSGPRGAILATLLAAAVFGGVWAVFTWLAPDPGTAPADVAVPTTTPTAPVTPTRAASPTPSPTPAPTPTPTPTPVDWETVAGQVSPAVTEVAGIRCQGRTVTGSGLLVSADQVVTAAHVVVRSPRIRVAVGAEARTARVVSLDIDRDLALLSLAEPMPGPPVPLVPGLVAVDDQVGLLTPGPSAGGAALTPVPVTAVGLRVPTRTGAVSDVLTVALGDDTALAGTPVVTADAGFAGMLLVDHVEGAVAGTGHVLSAEAIADRVTAWAGDKPSRHACPQPEPTATATETETPAPTPAPAPPVGADDPFAAEDVRWIAVLESFTEEQYRRRTMQARVRDWDEALSLPRQGIRTRLLRSDQWPSLRPGLWVLYLGQWGTVEQARAACEAVRSVSPGCYAADLRR